MNIFHVIMWGSRVLYQLYGFNFSGSNQDLDCSQFTLSGWRLEVVHPLFTPCAPATQQCYELKNEKSGGVWEKGLGSEGREWQRGRRGRGGQVNERGKKENILRLLSLQKVFWNNGQQRTVWRNKVTIQVYEGVLLTWCKFFLLWKMLTFRAFVKGGPFTTDYIPALHGTICQHKIATKQASDTCSSS